MSLKSRIRFFNTLSFKLTLWYSTIFFISILAGFFLFSLLLSSKLHKELDENLINEAKEITLLFERRNIHKVRLAMTLETESQGVEKFFTRLMNMNGETVFSTDDTSWKIGPGRRAINSIAGGDEYFFETISVQGRQDKVRAIYSRIGGEYILQIMTAMDNITKFLDLFRQLFLIIMGFMFFVSTIAGWFMAKRALTGVEEVTQTAIQVSDGKFDKRVKVKGHGEEIDRLATTFNSMLEKLHTLITDIKEISDNIAHDLRSPVTRIRGIAETTLMTARPDPEFETMAGSIIEECDSLLIMINTMLDISEAEAGVSKLNLTDVDLSKTINEACDLFQPIAEDKRINIIKEIGTGATVKADKDKIQRLVANLLDNALKYTPEKGVVNISLEQDQNNITVSVRDTGIGISQEDLSKIFNRFYRCDRSRSLQGIGLGLSLAKAIVQLHHGTISVSSELDTGSIFSFTLPRFPF